MLVRLARPYSLSGQIATQNGVNREELGLPCRCAKGNRITASGLIASRSEMKRKKSKKELDKAALAAVAKEMEQPRFAESARREVEAAGHQVANHRKLLG